MRARSRVSGAAGRQSKRQTAVREGSGDGLIGDSQPYAATALSSES
jgi:hypothetical protein